MSAAPKLKLTEAEYLVIERAAEFKSEFFNGEMFPIQGPGGLLAMAGATPLHNQVKENLSIEVGTRLKGSPCRSYSSDQRVKVERTGLYTYPDLIIVCGKPEFDRDDPNSLINPQVLIEVLSPSTESYDRGTKFQHYKRLPSMKEYVLVSTERVLMERLVRQPDETWLLATFEDPGGEFTFSSIAMRIPMEDVYRGVDSLDPPLAK